MSTRFGDTARPHRAGRRLGLQGADRRPRIGRHLRLGHTTLVLVEATGGRHRPASATPTPTRRPRRSIRDLLAEVVRGPRRDGACPGPGRRWSRRSATSGRPGIASMAISAVDTALWDLKARLLDLPLVTLLGRGPRRRAGLRQRRVHLVLDRAAPGAARRLGRRGHPAGEDEDRHATRPTTSAGSAPPARRSGPTPSCSSTPTAPTAASRRWPRPSGSPSWA